MSEDRFLNDVLRDLKSAMRDDLEAIKKSFGQHPGKEEVSRRQQMQAYEALTAEDLAQMESRYGPQQMAAYIMDMEKRRRRSDAAKQSLT